MSICLKYQLNSFHLQVYNPISFSKHTCRMSITRSRRISGSLLQQPYWAIVQKQDSPNACIQAEKLFPQWNILIIGERGHQSSRCIFFDAQVINYRGTTFNVKSNLTTGLTLAYIYAIKVHSFVICSTISKTFNNKTTFINKTCDQEHATLSAWPLPARWRCSPLFTRAEKASAYPMGTLKQVECQAIYLINHDP